MERGFPVYFGIELAFEFTQTPEVASKICAKEFPKRISQRNLECQGFPSDPHCEKLRHKRKSEKDEKRPKGQSAKKSEKANQIFKQRQQRQMKEGDKRENDFR